MCLHAILRSIDERELRIAMRALGFDVKKDEIGGLIAQIDSDGGGTIDFNEFMGLVSTATSKRDPKGEIQKVNCGPGKARLGVLRMSACSCAVSTASATLVRLT